jgi:hemerythrin
MAFIKFSDRFRVGHFLLDQQHEELFALLGQLHELARQKRTQLELKNAIAPLHYAIVNHFQTEENIMRNNLYPGYLDHKKIHDDLVSKLADVETKIKNSDDALPLSVAIFLKDWLKHYISEEDSKITKHLENQKTSPRLEP